MSDRFLLALIASLTAHFLVLISPGIVIAPKKPPHSAIQALLRPQNPQTLALTPPPPKAQPDSLVEKPPKPPLPQPHLAALRPTDDLKPSTPKPPVQEEVTRVKAAKPVSAQKKPAKPKPTKPTKTAQKPRSAQQVAKAQQKLAQFVFYPEQAVAQGIEGEVRLLLKISPTGEILEADIAASSGHDILDSAAIRAAYAMGQLAPEAAGEMILPVIFRLE